MLNPITLDKIYCLRKYILKNNVLTLEFLKFSRLTYQIIEELLRIFSYQIFFFKKHIKYKIYRFVFQFCAKMVYSK